MARSGKMNFKGFEQLKEDMKELVNNQDEFIESCAKELASVLWSSLVHNTPVDNGTLRRGWIVGDIIKQGNIYKIEIVNPVEYASYVEFGHRTANHKGWVNGRFFMQKSIQEIERLTPRILEDEIKEHMKDIFR